MQALCDLLGLLNIIIRGAPKEEASRHAPDGDGELQLCGHAEEAVFIVVGLTPGGMVMRTSVSANDWIFPLST
jgi:hypothetical protein